MFPILTFLPFLKSEATTHTHFQPPHCCCVRIPSLLGVGLLNQKLPEDFSLQGIYLTLNTRKLDWRKNTAPGTQAATPAAVQSQVVECWLWLSFMLLKRGQIMPSFRVLPLAPCTERVLLAKEGNTKSPCQRSRWAQTLCSASPPRMVPQRRAAGSGG